MKNMIYKDLLDMNKDEVDEKIDKVVTFLKKCEKKLTKKELESATKKYEIAHTHLSSIESNCYKIDQCRDIQKSEKKELEKKFLIIFGIFVLFSTFNLFSYNSNNMGISSIFLIIFCGLQYYFYSQTKTNENIKISGFEVSNDNLIRELKLQGIPNSLVNTFIRQYYKSLNFYKKFDLKQSQTNSDKIEQEKYSHIRGVLVFQIKIILMSLESKNSIFDTKDFMENTRSSNF